MYNSLFKKKRKINGLINNKLINRLKKTLMYIPCIF